jgi:hypothetical protein
MHLCFSGIGWKSWKKRWFILTRTSLVFFKSDPVSTSVLDFLYWQNSILCQIRTSMLLISKIISVACNISVLAGVQLKKNLRVNV